MLKPHIGNLVNYVLPARSLLAHKQHRAGAVRPAIVVAINNAAGPPEQQSLQLQVFTDQDNDGLPSVLWATSVHHDQEGKAQGTWHWPELSTPSQPSGAGLNFGLALAALKGGKRVARAGWNGKGMWLRYVDLYLDPEFKVVEKPNSQGSWLPFIVMKTVDGKLVPWLASQTDLLAEDWFLVEDRAAS